MQKNSLINKNNSFIPKVACLAICMSGSLASIPSRGEDSEGNGGKDPQKFKVEGMELPISPKISEIFNKYTFLVFPIFHTGSCIVYIVLEVEH